jgi:hypothetical protein
MTLRQLAEHPLAEKGKPHPENNSLNLAYCSRHLAYPFVTHQLVKSFYKKLSKNS